ncbi:hypothetical protein ACVWW4_003465 [Bradyrhizobium sp. LB7.1]
MTDGSQCKARWWPAWADHVVAKASHTGLPRHVAAIEQTIAFLRDGRFRTV